MTEKDLRKLLGDENYEKILGAAKRLKKKGLGPDAIAAELTKKFQHLAPRVFAEVVEAIADHVRNVGPP